MSILSLKVDLASDFEFFASVHRLPVKKYDSPIETAGNPDFRQEQNQVVGKIAFIRFS